LSILGVGCGTVVQVHNPSPLAKRARWVVLPVTNLADSVQAGERIEALLDPVLREHGVGLLDRYPALKEDEVHLLLSDRARYESALTWARNQRYDYGVTGTVEEWRYKAGNESEPAVGVTLSVIQLGDNKVVWSASGARHLCLAISSNSARNSPRDSSRLVSPPTISLRKMATASGWSFGLRVMTSFPRRPVAPLRAGQPDRLRRPGVRARSGVHC